MHLQSEGNQLIAWARSSLRRQRANTCVDDDEGPARAKPWVPLDGGRGALCLSPGNHSGADPPIDR